MKSLKEYEPCTEYLDQYTCHYLVVDVLTNPDNSMTVDEWLTDRPTNLLFLLSDKLTDLKYLTCCVIN